MLTVVNMEFVLIRSTFKVISTALTFTRSKHPNQVYKTTGFQSLEMILTTPFLMHLIPIIGNPRQ